MSEVTRARWCTPRQCVESGALMAPGYGRAPAPARPLPVGPSALATGPQHLGRHAVGVEGVDGGPLPGRGSTGERDLHRAVAVQIGQRGDLDALDPVTGRPAPTGLTGLTGRTAATALDDRRGQHLRGDATAGDAAEEHRRPVPGGR